MRISHDDDDGRERKGKFAGGKLGGGRGGGVD